MQDMMSSRQGSGYGIADSNIGGTTNPDLRLNGVIPYQSGAAADSEQSLEKLVVWAAQPSFATSRPSPAAESPRTSRRQGSIRYHGQRVKRYAFWLTPAG